MLLRSPIIISRLPHVPCSLDETLFCRNWFIRFGKECLSEFNFCLFTSILEDWESCPLLDSYLARKEKFLLIDTCESKDIQVPAFNVRGFDMS
jgi:hypothetical protein